MFDELERQMFAPERRLYLIELEVDDELAAVGVYKCTTTVFLYCSRTLVYCTEYLYSVQYIHCDDCGVATTLDARAFIGTE